MGGKRKITTMILPWVVWFVAVLFFCHQFFLRLSITGMADELLYNIHINTVTLSIIAASFYYAFFVWLLPGGILVDLYGPTKMMILATGMVSVGSIVFSLSNTAFQMDIGRILMGSGSAFSVLCAFSLIRLWFPQKMFSVVTGITFTLGFLGAALGAGPISKLVLDYGWRDVMWVASVISILIFCLTILFVRDVPEGNNAFVGKFEWKKAVYSLKRVFTNRQVMLAGTYGFFAYSIVSIFAALWSTFLLKTLYPHYGEYAGYGASIIFVGFAAGTFVFGILFRVFQRIKVFLVLSSLVCCLAFGVVLYIAIPLSLMFVLLFLLGFTSASTCLNMVIAKERVEKEVCATAFGVIGVFQVMGGTWGLLLVGRVLSLDTGYQIMTSVGNFYYTRLSLEHSLSIVFAFTVLAFISACCLRKLPCEK